MLACALAVLAATLGVVAQSCITLEDSLAVEVVLNKPGVSLNLAALLGSGHARSVSGEVAGYRSGFDDRLVVLVGYTRISASYPFIRVQVPVAGGKPLYAVGEGEVVAVLREELERLASQGVLRGLTAGDIEAIASRARLGDAGWDLRLVYEDGEWKPFNTTKMYTPLSACPVHPELDYESLPVYPAPGPRIPVALLVAVALAVAIAIYALRLRRKRSPALDVRHRSSA